MLVLALLATLAAPPGPTTTPGPASPALASLPRVPGTRLRLGMTESQLLSVGSFVAVSSPQAGSLERKGPARFFGVPGEATCTLRDGLLAEVRFEAAGVGPHSLDYVDGQLRMWQLERRCQPDEAGDRKCDWTSPMVRIHTEVKKDHLSARAMRWPPPAARAPDSLHAGERAGAAPDSLHAAAKATSAPAVRPSAAAPAGGGTSSAGAGAAAAGAAASLGVIAAPRDSAPQPAAPVATLPETLAITLANRNQQQWPRILSSPQLHYPEKARKESLQGVVWVLALVDPSGKVLEASIDRSVRDLDEAALAWVQGSQFAPCEKNGAPCRFRVRVAVLFTLY